MNYTPLFDQIKVKCLRGTPGDIDSVMALLNSEVDLPTTRAVDFYVGTISTEKGIRRLEHYLFEGTLIQRNYCALFFARRNDWDLINEAFRRGKIDAVQAYAR